MNVFESRSRLLRSHRRGCRERPCLCGCAGRANDPWAAERIAVHAEYGVYGGRAYLDIDELATALREAHPVTLEVIACGPAAVDAFIRAVPYFSASALVPQVADAGHLACLTPALLRIAQGSQPFATKGEVAAAKYWSEVAP